MRYAFGDSSKLVSIPLLDTSKVTNMSYSFQNCSSLTIISQLDTSNVDNMQYAFKGCKKLTSLPLIDTSKVTNFNYTFSQCENLTEIPNINTSSAKGMSSMFSECHSLSSLPYLYCGNISSKNSYPLYTTYSKGYEYLTDVGGFVDMKMSWDNNYGLVKCPNLSYQSCINILNGLYDFTGNGVTPNSNQGQLKVHQNFLDLVGDEISIGTNKGWNIFV
jgi:surface protein